MAGPETRRLITGTSMVLWIIGLSRSGKTTLGRAVYQRLKASHPNTVLLDGDEVREAFGNDLGHTVQDRWTNAKRLMGLCRLLTEQGVHVVCCVLSIFPDSQAWNREHLKDYFEVYLEVPFEELVRRDTTGLYAQARRGEITHVVGVDIDFPVPKRPDLVIRNTGSVDELLAQAERIAQLLPGLEAGATAARRV